MKASTAAEIKARLERGESPLWEQSLTHPEQLRLTWSDGIQDTVPTQPCFFHRLSAPIHLVICGGGHVAQALAASASAVGFQITVLEDRPEVLQEGQFPPETELRLGSVPELVRTGKFPPNAFYAVMTRNHNENRRCLRAVMDMPHGYVGMLGSRRDAEALRQWLIEDGVPEETVAGLHHPIGLPIAAETPAEIAVAVTAELIQCRKTLDLGSALEQTVLDGLSAPPYAWVMLVDTKGITPRKPGASMLVYPDGSVRGTIGGGAREAAAIRQAQKVLHTRRAGCFTYPENGAVPTCGGIVTYTIVPVEEDD